MEEDNRVGGAGSTSGSEKDGKTEETKRSQDELLYEFGFATFILSLSTSVLVNLGELPDPITNQKEVNMQLAKQTISIIEMLQQKTQGNLTKEEDQLLENVLSDIRLKYVQTMKK
jgi:hypothetical protein